jgi:hypothetical protein
VSAFFVNKVGPVPFHAEDEIDERSFDVVSDVVPGRKQIAAIRLPMLF